MKRRYEAPCVLVDKLTVRDVITLSCIDGDTGMIVAWPGTEIEP